jgi:hypothetical protein
MSKSPRLIITSALMILAILACNLPGGQNNSQPELAETITAQALTLQSGASGSPAGTPSPSSPEVSVTSPTNCRTGPSTDYDLVFTMNPGATAQVVGKDTPDNYWIINKPTGGTCWLWGQYAVLSGSTGSLPEYPPPPKPTPKFTKTPKPTHAPTLPPTLAKPNAPSNLSGAYDRTCAGDIRSDGTPIWVEQITLTWQDNANNETGYRVYKNGTALPDLPPNSTSFHITLRYPQGTGPSVALWDNIGVEAFNSAGVSERISVDVPRCP